MSRPRTPGCIADLLDLKASIRERDGMACVMCGMPDAQHRAERGRCLEVHRIDNAAGYSLDNCVTVCKPCHARRPYCMADGSIGYRINQSGCKTIKVAQSIYQRLRFISAMECIPVCDIVNEIITPMIEEDYRRALAILKSQQDA